LSHRSAGERVAALRDKWDRRHGSAEAMPAPAAVLRENLHLLPARGTALDLACGLGANALLLARHGLTVTAWDLSPVAIARLGSLASELALPIAAEVRDVCAEPPPACTFDCILVAHFLERPLAPALAAALRPGGLLFYQTFARDAVNGRGPSDPCFRLATNELLHLFPGLTLRFYREEGRLGDLSRGTRDLVQLIGQRPGA
jgi:tellurite methyltransferase